MSHKIFIFLNLPNEYFFCRSLGRLPRSLVPREVEGVRLWPRDLLSRLLDPVVPAHLLDEGDGLLLGGEIHLQKKAAN